MQVTPTVIFDDIASHLLLEISTVPEDQSKSSAYALAMAHVQLQAYSICKKQHICEMFRNNTAKKLNVSCQYTTKHSDIVAVID